MGQNYLDKFRSTLPTTQGNRLLSRLIQQKDSGEIRTLDEFKNKLKTLTADLLSEQIAPTLKLYKAIVGEEISSEQWNHILSLIQDDLETAFTEANNIDDILEAHRNLIQDVSLKTIRYAIKELEAKISFYEFAYQSRYGFDSSLFNTFKESKDISTSRTEQLANVLYKDPRAGITIDNDASVDLIGQRLTLGAITTYADIYNVEWLSNAHSHRSEISVNFSDNQIKNVIDQTNNTYWIESLLFSSPRPTGAFIEICIKFPGARDINFVEISPAAAYAMNLAQIDYYNTSNQRLTITTPDIILTGSGKVYFGRVNAQALVLRFKQVNYQEIQFKQSAAENNFQTALSGKGKYKIDITTSAKDLRNILSSDFLITDLLAVPSDAGKTVRFYQYMFGIDNINPGYSIYQDKSIFVSKSHNVDALGLVGLKIDETRPTQINDGEITQSTFTYLSRSTTQDNTSYYSNIEYWLTAFHYTKDDHLITTDILPILPLDAERIYHETLILSHKSDASQSYSNMGSPRFFYDADTSDVILYRNRIPIPYGTSWEFVSSSTNATLTVSGAGLGSRMKRGIQILNAVDPLDIYTVSYTPKLSNTAIIPQVADTLMQIVDMSGDRGVKLINNNLLLFDGTRMGLSIAYSRLYLSVILRRCTAQEHLTSAVEEYMLLTSSVNTEKFIKEYE